MKRAVLAALLLSVILGACEDTRYSTEGDNVVPPPTDPLSFNIRYHDKNGDDTVRGTVPLTPVSLNNGESETFNVSLGLADPVAAVGDLTAGKIPALALTFERPDPSPTGCFPLNLAIDFDTRAFTPTSFGEKFPGIAGQLLRQTLPSAFTPATRISIGYRATDAPTSARFTIGVPDKHTVVTAVDVVPHRSCTKEKKFQLLGAYQDLEDLRNPKGLDLALDFDPEPTHIGANATYKDDVADVDVQVQPDAAVSFSVSELPERDESRGPIVNGITSPLPNNMHVTARKGFVEMKNSRSIESAIVVVQPSATDTSSDALLTLKGIPAQMSIEYDLEGPASKATYRSSTPLRELKADIGNPGAADMSLELVNVPTLVTFCFDSDGKECVSRAPADNVRLFKNARGFPDNHAAGARPELAEKTMSAELTANTPVTLKRLVVRGVATASNVQFQRIRFDYGKTTRDEDYAYLVFDTDNTGITGNFNFTGAGVKLAMLPPGIQAQNFIAFYDGIGFLGSDEVAGTGGQFSCRGTTLTIDGVPTFVTDLVVGLCS